MNTNGTVQFKLSSFKDASKSEAKKYFRNNLQVIFLDSNIGGQKVVGPVTLVEQEIVKGRGTIFYFMTAEGKEIPVYNQTYGNLWVRIHAQGHGKVPYRISEHKSAPEIMGNSVSPLRGDAAPAVAVMINKSNTVPVQSSSEIILSSKLDEMISSNSAVMKTLTESLIKMSDEQKIVSSQLASTKGQVADLAIVTNRRFDELRESYDRKFREIREEMMAASKKNGETSESDPSFNKVEIKTTLEQLLAKLAS